MKFQYFFAPLICVACDQQNIVTSCENAVEGKWSRQTPLKNKFSIAEDASKLNLVLDIFYEDDVQFQNIFLQVKVKNAADEVVFEKNDLMLMLFDAKTGYPLGRKLFKDQHLEFLVGEKIALRQGDYSIEISQLTRAENLYGIKKLAMKILQTT